ncbi:MAG: prolipoprotein diacylglyceryl transferase [Lachnospiraceae bacterium]|nr:prolipoprotein diacylglyceryl transferase [Lachnospiraceae bacterium]
MINDIQLGPVTIHMYGLMIAIGVFLALVVSLHRAKKLGLDEGVIYDILYCAIIGGALGTRILYYITVMPDIIKDPSILWNFKEGYVVYGGVVGGVIAGAIYCKIKKVSFLKYFDLVMPQVVMAQGIGRFGCFFAGCCYGKETDLPIGITYTISKFAPNGVALLPTQLISSAGDFIIFAILLYYAKRKKSDGTVGAMYLIIYSIGRFFVEFLRADERGAVGVLSTSQFIAIGTLGLGILLFFIFKKIGKSSNEPVH